MSNIKQLNLSDVGVAKHIATRISEDIDAFCVAKYDDGHRNHLGGSMIGDECMRKLWYSFRWVKHIKFDGRMQRLFNRGHREEDRFIEWLEGIGCKLYERDTNKPLGKDGKHPQFRISAVDGHFGGSLDGICILPPEYGINEPVLAEFKTSSDKAFAKMKKSGMAVSKPLHFAQTSTYGADDQYLFNYCLYMMINKNNDEIHVEIVKLDHEHGKRMKIKAERIITSQTPPPKLSENKTFQTCVYCDFKDVCHDSTPSEKNCRSCVNAIPVQNANWGCKLYNQVIPLDVIKTGCVSWSDILKG